MKKIKVLSGLTGLSLYLVLASSFLFLLLPAQTSAQSQENKGLPFITNYRYQDYNADGVNWWATEDDKGVMYFANNLGVLMYDGQTWELVKPDGSPETRCVVKGKDGKIYVGTNGDFGYVDADEKGKIKFISLKNKLPEKYRQFAEVWECNRLDDKIIFRTTNNLFIWDGKNIKVIDSYENLHVGNVVGKDIYVRIWNRGLTILKNDSFHIVPGGERFANERIYVMLAYDENRMLIGTRTQGLFIYDGKQFTPFKTEADPYIVNTSLYGGQVLPNGNFALNAFNDGMVIITKEGKLVQRINKAVGLQDNSVDHIFLDSKGMLWMSMFNGIAKLDLRSSLSFYDESTGLPAKTVFGTGIHNDVLYAGTNNGVFVLDKNTNRFQKVEGTSGQINSFLLKGNDYLVGAADRGLLKVIGDKSYTVIPGNNYDFHVTQLIQSTVDSNVIYALLREGTAVVRYTPGNNEGNRYAVESINKKLTAGFGGLIERKDGLLWIVDGGKGEINLVAPLRSSGKVDIANATIKNFNSLNGLPRRPVGPISYNDQTYFVAGKDSVFVYDEKQKRFLQDTGNFLSNHLVDFADGTGIFVKDIMGRLWVNLGGGVMVIAPGEAGSPKIINAPFRELKKNYPVWHIMPSVDKNGQPVVWFSSREGIIRYDGNLEETANTKFNTIIRGITLNEDSVYFSGLSIPGEDHSFSSKWNSIRIQYAAPFFKLENETVFSTFLEGKDKSWSDWNKQSFREFGNLPAGNYTFKVKAKNIYDVESSVAVFSFSVSPPWYASWWAYLLYALIAATVIYAIVRMRTKQLHEKHRLLEKVVDERTAQLSNRVDELAVINSVQDGLVREVKMAGIYELVGEKIREIFNAQVIDIATYDSTTNIMEDHYAYEKGDRTLYGTFEPNGFRKHVVESGQTLVINEELEKRGAEYGGKVLLGEMPKSAVFIPMISGGKVSGIISLQNLDHENAFSPSQVSMLTTLANSMSVALESARRFDETHRLLKETEQRNAELAVINSVQDGLVREMDMQGIYELVGEKIREIFDAQVIDIVTYDRSTNMIEDRYANEKGDRSLLPARLVKGFRKHVIETGEYLMHNENVAQAVIDYDNEVLIGDIPKSQVYVPLVSSNEVNGVISLQNLDHEHAFTESDVRLINTLATTMSIALESARLFDETKRLLKETEQRNAELAVINSVQDGLVREMDMQGIYELVGEKIREIFDAQVIDIVTYDRRTNMIEDRYSYEKGDRSLLPARLVKGFRKHVIETREYLMFNENAEQALKDYDHEVLIGDKAKSIVFVPLISGNEVNGVISLQNLDHEHAFNESDVRLINTLANTMSIALESARLFDETKRLLKETEQRTAELGVINSVQDGLAREMDIQGIYELVGEKIRKIFNAQVIDIVIYDKATNLIEDRYAFENGDRTLFAARELSGFRKHVIETTKPLVINKDVDKERPKYNQAIIKGEGAKSLVMVPMMASGEVNGVISLQNLKQENAFPEADIKLLNTLANSMSVALENARLFDETNRLLKETEQRTAELGVINSVQEGLVREMNIKAIYELVGDRICKLFDTQTVIIRTFDHESSKEIWQYAIEKGEPVFSEPRAFNWANKELIKNKKSLFINENYAETAKKFGGAGVTKGFPPKSALFVPMIVGKEVKGSVSLQNVEKEKAFSESDLRLLTTLANSMSVALENARLFDESNRLLGEAKQRANELSTVNNISQALTSQLNLDDLINLVGEQMKQLFKANIVYLAILDDKTKIINFPYQYGDVIEPMKLGEGLTSKIILTGKPLLVNKDLDQLTEQLGVEKLGLPAASYLGVPIPVGDEVIGVLSIQTTEMVNRFNEDDQRLLTTIAASVGIALRKAKLFDEVHVAKLEAEAARKNAERANDAKSSFLSTVSHELRTPLTSVLGFAKIIKKRLEDKVFPVIDKDDAKLQKTINQVSDNLDVVVSEGERLTHLINDVLDLAKIEAGKMEWNNEPVSVAEIAERAIAATTSLFAQNKLELKKNIATDLPDISGDRDKLIQVMVNLISNSVKFTPKGTVTCKVFQNDDEIIVSIADTGIGIAPEDHAAVFEQFKQVGDTLTDKPKGTGLGLPICMEIVEHHGGRIWLESELCKGSTFFVAIPISKSNEPRAVHLNDLVKQLKVQVAHSQLNMKDKAANILIVDDDESIRALLNQELSELGYLVDEAKDGKEALVKVRANRPDLIILDIMMPEMNGFDVAAVLKNDPVTMDIPIIVLSIVQDKTRGFRIGVDRYLTKPIDTGLLFNEIGSLLEQGKSKKKVMVVDEDLGTVNTLTEVLKTKGYNVSESDGSALIADAIANQPDIIIINSVLSGKNDIVQTLRFEKGLENVLFFVYK